jgi:hypothetical protein
MWDALGFGFWFWFSVWRFLFVASLISESLKQQTVLKVSTTRAVLGSDSRFCRAIDVTPYAPFPPQVEILST